jgi:uncharacterized repeat protein (TIGR01451 family)
MRSHLMVFILLFTLLVLPTLVSQAEIVTVVAGTYQEPALAVVNGYPAMFYVAPNGSSRDLRFVRALDATGTTWGIPVTVATGTSLYTHRSLQIVNGNPAVTYTGVLGNNDLMYVRALDVNGTTWGSPVTIDTQLGGSIPSLAVINGNPAITYTLGASGTLSYVRATDVNGTSWGTPVIVDAGGFNMPSLITVNGNPAISYGDSTNSKFARALDVNGTTWGTPVDVVGLFSGIPNSWYSLQVVNGNPAMLVYEDTGEATFVRATDANGTTWGTSLIVTPPLGTQNPSLRMVNGNPAILYVDATTGDSILMFRRATDANGTAWGTPVAIDPLLHNNGLFAESDIVIVNGNPAVAYIDESGSVNYARACDANGTIWLPYCQVITLAFAAASSSAPEASGFGNLLRVTTSDGNPSSEAVTVTVSVTGGTATGADYGLSGTITIPAGTANNALVSITSGIQVIDESLVEPDETIDLLLTSPSAPSVQVLLGSQSSSIHTIINDDHNSPNAGNGGTGQTGANPQIAIFDPAISKAGFLHVDDVSIHGEELEWLITLSNPSTVTGTNVVVTDTLRPELRIMRVVAPQGSVNISGQTVTVTFAVLAPQQIVQFSIFTSVSDGLSFENTACVQANGITPECASTLAVSSLPITGETPWWHGIVVGIAVCTGLIASLCVAYLHVLMDKQKQTRIML